MRMTTRDQGSASIISPDASRGVPTTTNDFRNTAPRFITHRKNQIPCHQLQSGAATVRSSSAEMKGINYAGNKITGRPHRAQMHCPQKSERRTTRAPPGKKQRIPLKHKIRQYCTPGEKGTVDDQDYSRTPERSPSFNVTHPRMTGDD